MAGMSPQLKTYCATAPQRQQALTRKESEIAMRVDRTLPRHQELIKSKPPITTVTEIATRWGSAVPRRSR
jgi:hypothetical protein